MSGAKPQADLDAVAAWLEARHGSVEGLEPLSGGFWSAAYGYRAGGESLVLRLSDSAEGFDIDAAAAAEAAPVRSESSINGR